MKIRVFDIDYDITTEDIEDSVNYILEVQDLLFANEDLSEIDVDMGIADAVEYENWSIIFSDLDDEIIYCYRIDEVDKDEDRVHCVLTDKYSYDDFIANIEEEQPWEIIFNISDDELEDTNIEDELAHLISDTTDYLVQGFDWEEIED